MEFPFQEISQIPLECFIDKYGDEYEVLAFVSIHGMVMADRNFAVVNYAKEDGVFRMQEARLFQWFEHAQELYEKTVKYLKQHDWKKQGF